MTKIFLLLALVFATKPFDKSISIRVMENALVIEVTDANFHVKECNAPCFTDADHHFIIGTIPGEEDGKMHYFHYDRIKRTRRRVWLRSLLRGLLVITHLGFLLYEMLASHS